MEKNPANNAVQQDDFGKDNINETSDQVAPLKRKCDQIIIKPSGNQQIDQQIDILRTRLVIPKRKNPGTGGELGRQTELEVNYLPLNFEKLFKKTVYQYDCKFTPELPKHLLRTALGKFVDKHYQGIHFTFDGRRNMYTTIELKGKSDFITITDENGRSLDLIISTLCINQINMGKIGDYLKNGSSNCLPEDAFQVLNIVLKNRPLSLGFTNIGMSFFPLPPMKPTDLGEGMELWKGFSQRVVIGWKPYLNIDVTYKGFPKNQLLTSYIEKDLNCSLDTELDYISKNKLSNFIKGLKVEYLIPNQPSSKRTFKVFGLLDSSVKFMFEMDESHNDFSKTKQSKLTVFQFFKLARDYVIKYPNLPCLHVGNVNRINAIPIELCTVKKGQFNLKKFTENQRVQMVKNTIQSPADRQKSIESYIEDIKYNNDLVLKEFGIDVHEEFASIPARVLDQPSLVYFQNRETKPNAGVWKADQFSKAVKLTRWAVLNLDIYTKFTTIKDFERMLIQCGKGLNVMISPMANVCHVELQEYYCIDTIKRNVQNFFNKTKQSPNGRMELIVVIIPDNLQGIYAAVKQSSELQVGVLTQCIKSKTMIKMNDSTVRNILMKINSKLNGINHTMSANSYPSSMSGAIIFGADVNRQSSEKSTIPTVAAVTATHDLSGSQYNMEWRLQMPNIENIQDLENIIHKQLLKYMDKTNNLPKKILYYRDGVGAGQFSKLLNYELIAIRRACLRINMKYKPPITFLVVQKRHHTRMFPKNPIDMDGKFQNVPSGTIVDTQITHPTEVDFYLCSRANVQGTSRPTRYHLIWDDNNFTDDELQQITYHLCFMIARCTQSVSHPAPTYYARLAAYRARIYIDNKKINLNHLEEEHNRIQLNEFFAEETPMYFI